MKLLAHGKFLRKPWVLTKLRQGLGLSWIGQKEYRRI